MTHYYTYDSNLRDRNKFTSTVETTFGTKRYFSSLDTEVYFGQTQIDEMVAIDFTIAEPKLPIYGYNSFYPNRIVAGRRTVQGTFAINFTHTMYLLNILKDIDDSILANDYEALVYRCPEEDSTGLGIGNSAIFNKQFDITISYGYGKTEGKQTYNSCYQTIVGVHIVDYRQALDTEGNPILDMYSFIAKDIRYQESTSSEEGSTPSDEVVPPEQQEPSTDLTTDPIVVIGDPVFANGAIDATRATLEAKCANTEVPGFIITPIFHENKLGYAISLSISSVNNSTKTFKNISATITDNSITNKKNNVNFSVNFKDLENGSISDVMLSDSLRDSAAQIMKRFQEGREGPTFAVTFTADFNGQEKELSYTTYLIKK